MTFRNLILTALALTALFSCKKSDPAEIDLGYTFFPNTARAFIIYRVDSTSYGISEEEFQFQIKELLANEFVDGQGDAAILVERYKRLNSSEEWVLQNVWVQKRTPTAAERVEDNVRYVKMAFPVVEAKTWNGNAYNTLGEWEYTFENVDKPTELGIQVFSKTVKVNQRNNVNLVDQEIAYEIYARNVGMVYKRFTDLNTQLGQVSGVEVIMTALTFGYEL